MIEVVTDIRRKKREPHILRVNTRYINSLITMIGAGNLNPSKRNAGTKTHLEYKLENHDKRIKLRCTLKCRIHYFQGLLD